MAAPGRRRRAPPPPGELAAHAGGVQTLAFSPDGRYLASGGADKKVQVWDVREGRPLVVTPSQTEPISAVTFVGPGTVLFGLGVRGANLSRPSTLFRLELASGKTWQNSFDVVNGIRALAGLPDRRVAAWATDNRVLRVQEIIRPPQPPMPLKNDCRALALSADGRRLAVTSDWEVLLFDVDRWPQQGSKLGRHEGVVTALAFGPDGRTLYTGAWDNTVRVWDVERGSERARFTWPTGSRVTALAVSPDGLRAAAGGDAGTVAIWDLD